MSLTHSTPVPVVLGGGDSLQEHRTSHACCLRSSLHNTSWCPLSPSLALNSWPQQLCFFFLPAYCSPKKPIFISAVLGRDRGCFFYDTIASQLCRANAQTSRLLGANLRTPDKHQKNLETEPSVTLKWRDQPQRLLGSGCVWPCNSLKCLFSLPFSPQRSSAVQLALPISASPCLVSAPMDGELSHCPQDHQRAGVA